jgi:hypothetical protein
MYDVLHVASDVTQYSRRLVALGLINGSIVVGHALGATHPLAASHAPRPGRHVTDRLAERCAVDDPVNVS